VISFLLQLGLNVNMEDEVSTATSEVTLNSGVAVMVEMVGCGGEGWSGGGSGV
jgi:hypothetical protein